MFTQMFGTLSSFPEIILRSAIVYIVLILSFRIAGKRHISQLSLIDFVLVLLVSNAVQNAMVGSDSSVGGGIAAAFTLILINLAFSKLIFRSKRASHLIEGEPTLLIRNGKPLETHLHKEQISTDELCEAIREHGIPDIRHVRTAILELDGSISCIPYNESHHVEHHLPPLKRNRHVQRRSA